jgi:hypothetical protein
MNSNRDHLLLDDFRNEGAVKNFKVPGTTVKKHLDQIMAKEFDAPMFHNEFHLSVYIPKQAMMDANTLIKATRLQSLWISNFKKSLATTTISKVLARWLETTLLHTTKETKLNPKYHPALGKGHDMYYQEACTVKNYKNFFYPYEGKVKLAYG